PGPDLKNTSRPVPVCGHTHGHTLYNNNVGFKWPVGMHFRGGVATLVAAQFISTRWKRKTLRILAWQSGVGLGNYPFDELGIAACKSDRCSGSGIGNPLPRIQTMLKVTPCLTPIPNLLLHWLAEI